MGMLCGAFLEAYRESVVWAVSRQKSGTLKMSPESENPPQKQRIMRWRAVKLGRTGLWENKTRDRDEALSELLYRAPAVSEFRDSSKLQPSERVPGAFLIFTEETRLSSRQTAAQRHNIQ